MAEVAEVGRQNGRGDDGLGSHGEDARSLERGDQASDDAKRELRRRLHGPETANVVGFGR